MIKKSKMSRIGKRVMAGVLCLLMLLDGSMLVLANEGEVAAEDPAQTIQVTSLDGEEDTTPDDGAENGTPEVTETPAGDVNPENTDTEPSVEPSSVDVEEEPTTEAAETEVVEEPTTEAAETEIEELTEEELAALALLEEELALQAELERLEAIYNGFVERVEALEVAGILNDESVVSTHNLREQIEQAYAEGNLTEERCNGLTERIYALLDAYYMANPPTDMGDADFNLEEAYQEIDRLLEAYGTPLMEEEAAPMMYSLRRQAAPMEPESDDSRVQVVNPGGETTQDDVTISKTIAGTSVENVFDITLRVTTKENLSELYKDPDMAVVIVMDISNTMRSKFPNSTTSRYSAALAAAEDFINVLAANSTGTSQVGFVAFNTDAHQILSMSSCTESNKDSLISKIKGDTGYLMSDDAYDITLTPEQIAKGNTEYDISHDRFTNIEAGLKMGYEMIKNAPNENKYIIFLSDGFPTTYVKSGTDYQGWDPYTTTGNAGNLGVFYDALMGVHCDYGTSYSETAAIRARERATTIKNNGVSIFSIGVDVSGQSIKYYSDDSETRLKSASTVDRPKTSRTEAGWYEIGYWDPTHPTYGKSNFENWLKGGKNTGIGSGEGYYYSVQNSEALMKAYQGIFEKIKIEITQKTEADWIATDPIPENVEFIGFYDSYGILQEQGVDLYGGHALNAEDTASFASDQISWQVKESGYTTEVDGTTTWYTYELTYRVRLENEQDDFNDTAIDAAEVAAETVYQTNGTTTLDYRVSETRDGVTVRSDEKQMDFEIPSVKGFLVEFQFRKVDEEGNGLEGAEFTLTHDENCTDCDGDHNSDTVVSLEGARYTAVSDANGLVSFAGIPSGHIYKLEETDAPTGFVSSAEVYTVTAAYDVVTIKDADGEDVIGNLSIVNRKVMELPEAGGIGTGIYLVGGSILMLASAGLSIANRSKKRRKDDAA